MSNFNVSNFVINNIDLLIALVIAIIGLVQAIIAKNKHQVYNNIYDLVSEAEDLAKKQGINKFIYVLDKAYNKLPWYIKWFISEDDVKRAIEYSLNKFKEFAKQQSIDTSIETTSENATTNTNIQTAADIAAQTIQNVSSTDNETQPVIIQ